MRLKNWTAGLESHERMGSSYPATSPLPSYCGACRSNNPDFGAAEETLVSTEVYEDNNTPVVERGLLHLSFSRWLWMC
jgi:hypothetical protein